MIVNVVHLYKKFLIHYLYKENPQFALKTNCLSVEQILKDMIDFKKRFSFSTHCAQFIDFYLKTHHSYFAIKHFELAFKSYSSIFAMIKSILRNEISYK